MNLHKRALAILAFSLYFAFPALSPVAADQTSTNIPTVNVLSSGRSHLDFQTLAGKYFELVRHNPVLERSFLYRMPKGGDIHNHLSGTVLAESYIRWAAALHYCVCVNQTCGTDTQYTIKTPAQSLPACESAAGLQPIAQSIRNRSFYNAMIDALSMRNFVSTNPASGHDHFFATFAKFGAISGVMTGAMLAEVASVWHAEKVKYLELMLSLSGGAGARKLLSGMTWDPPRCSSCSTTW